MEHAAFDGLRFMKVAADFIGIVFDACTDQGPCLFLPFLGNLEDYSRTLHDEVFLCAKLGRLYSGVGASLRGTLLHISAGERVEQHFPR